MLVKELFSFGLHVLGDVGLGTVFEAVLEAIKHDVVRLVETVFELCSALGRDTIIE